MTAAMRATDRALPRIAGWLALAATPVAAVEPLLHVGRLADGTVLPAAPLTAWHEAGGQPALAGKPLFDPANPVRWIRCPEADAGVAAGGGFVEFVGGDRLPGLVEGSRLGSEGWLESLPPHLIVKPSVAVDPPPTPPAQRRLRVISAAVRRVVWQPTSGRPVAANTLRRTDGSEIEFRSLRWSGDSVLLLLEQGTRRIGFGEIAELAVSPGSDRGGWDDYFDIVATVSPSTADRLVRIEVPGGIVATAAVTQLRATGNAADPRSWLHQLKPAWSLDPIWVAHREIASRWLFAAAEPPLPLVAPSRVERRSVFGGSWAWRANRGVRGTPLAANGLWYGWGFGVQADCDLFFPLPEIATALRTGVALDDVAGPGGCATTRICLDSASAKPLWEAGPLVGTADPVDSGPIPVPPSGGGATLVLAAGMAHRERPAGADPFDVRDLVDWIDPVVSLDPERLLGIVQARLPGTIPAWNGWTVVLPGGATLAVQDVPDAGGGWRRQVIGQGGPLTLGRSLRVDESAKHLMVGLARTAASASRFEIRIDGETVAAADVPERKPGAAVLPFLFPLARFTGSTIEVEVVHMPADDKGLVEWFALGPVGDDPTWRPLVPATFHSEAGADGAITPDGVVRVTGRIAEDTYTVEAELPADLVPRAVLLETLPAADLPGQGPGRAGDGNFVITGFAAALTPAAASSPLKLLRFASAAATFEAGGHPVAHAIDAAPGGGWAIGGGQGRPQAAMFRIADNQSLSAGGRLTVTIEQRHPSGQHALGRFRLAVSDAPPASLAPRWVVLPDEPRAAEPAE